MLIPEAIRFDWRASDLRESIDALPAGSGIYLLQPKAGSPHLAWSGNLRRRMSRLFFPSSASSKASLARLRENVVEVWCWTTASRLETSLAMYSLAREYFPDDYLFRLKLRIPWFVGLTVGDAFPRLSVINRVPRRERPLFGPFANRSAAQVYEQQVSGLFQIRRCTDTLYPSPEHPGCVYGEMNQCMRPCQSAVTRQEYATETQRVSEFLTSNGRSAIAALSTARDRAADQTEFEQAAQMHRQIEKMRGAAGVRNEVVANVYYLNGVALTRGLGPRELRLWPMLEGRWQEGLRLEIPQDDSQAKSLDQAIRELLTKCLQTASNEGQRTEDLAIFARWYYSSWRDGEWFPFGKLEDLNYRRLVRAISSMMKTTMVSAANR